MLKWLIRFIRNGVVADVPADLDRCLDCDKLRCSEADFETCARRKQRAREIAEARKESASF
jgi:hypothetical protein